MSNTPENSGSSIEIAEPVNFDFNFDAKITSPSEQAQVEPLVLGEHDNITQESTIQPASAEPLVIGGQIITNLETNND